MQPAKDPQGVTKEDSIRITVLWKTFIAFTSFGSESTAAEGGVYGRSKAR